MSKTFTVEAARNATLEVRLSAYLRGESGSVTVRVVNEGGTKRLFTLNSLEDEAVIERRLSRSLEGFHGETVTVEVVVRGDARAAVDYLRYYANSDGDGLTDNEEREGFHTSMGRTISPNPALADSDDDGLEDGRELDVTTGTGRRDRVTRSLELLSDPTDVDSDDDGLDDHTEVTGWTVNVTYRGEDQDGRPYRWDWSDDPDAIINVSSNPLAVDSDGDEATDTEGKNQLHTDPQSWRTYEITLDHQRDILEKVGEMDASRRRAFIEAMNLPCFGAPRCQYDWGNRLVVRAASDGVGDFDFVYPGMERGKSFDNLNDRIQFTALDGTTRVDTWVRNDAEAEHGTDPRDPDTDDDGLTDGQELEHILKVLPPETDVNLPVISVPGSWTNGQVSSPTDPHTDGDGYWDGWLGVYGVDRSEDVVLYREHLNTGQGVANENSVDEQVQIHETQSVSDTEDSSVAWGTDIDEDGQLEHSTVHLGERHWQRVAPESTQRGDPLRSGITPSPSLTLEVDHYKYEAYREKVRVKLPTLFTNASTNYALYGMDIEYVIDDEFQQDDLVGWI